MCVHGTGKTIVTSHYRSRSCQVVGHSFKHYSSILESCISTFGAKSHHVIFRGNIYFSIQSGESRGILLLLWGHLLPLHARIYTSENIAFATIMWSVSESKT